MTVRAFGTRPLCDTCWAKRTTEIPHRLRIDHRVVERCAECGADTWSGIYVRLPIEE